MLEAVPVLILGPPIGEIAIMAMARRASARRRWRPVSGSGALPPPPRPWLNYGPPFVYVDPTLPSAPSSAARSVVAGGGNGKRMRPKFLGGWYTPTLRRQAMSILHRDDVERHSEAPDQRHAWPKSSGGTAEDYIIVWNACNKDKADMSLEEFANWLEVQGDSRAVTVRALADRQLMKGSKCTASNTF